MKNYLNDLEKDVLSRMIDNLDDLEGRDGYVSELAFTLFENENINGSMTYSTYKAEQWIAEHFHDLADVVEDMAADWTLRRTRSATQKNSWCKSFSTSQSSLSMRVIICGVGGMRRRGTQSPMTRRRSR